MSSITQTVLFTDLANYTEAVQDSSRQEIRELIKHHRELVAHTLQIFGGELIKEIGDSFLFLFGSATDALKAAVKLMESLDERPRFQIRVALATGDVERIGGDAFGDTVNLASRILNNTPVGQIYFSQSTQLSMNQSEIAWMTVGLLSFKGFFGRHYVYKAVTIRNFHLPSILRNAIKQRTLRVGGTHETALLPKHIILLYGSNEEVTSQLAGLPPLSPANIWRIGDVLSPKERWEWEHSGYQWLIGESELLLEHIRDLESEFERNDTSDTIILKNLNAAIASVQLVGLALPKVPLSNIVSSYTYDLLSTGEFVLNNPLSVLRIMVLESGSQIQALHDDVQVSGRKLPVGAIESLKQGDIISWQDITYQFTVLENETYVGLLTGHCSREVPIGLYEAVEIGREPQGEGMVISDRRGQSNIQWCVGGRANEAQFNGFSIDRAMSGRRQAKVLFEHGQLRLYAIHQQCPTYLLDNIDLNVVKDSVEVLNGSKVVTGTSVLLIQGAES